MHHDDTVLQTQAAVSVTVLSLPPQRYLPSGCLPHPSDPSDLLPFTNISCPTCSFLSMIFLVSLNVAIAILTSAFDAVHEATKSVDRWKEVCSSIDEDVIYLMRVKLKVWTRPLRRWCKAQCTKRATRASSVPLPMPTSGAPHNSDLGPAPPLSPLADNVTVTNPLNTDKRTLQANATEEGPGGQAIAPSGSASPPGAPTSPVNAASRPSRKTNVLRKSMFGFGDAPGHSSVSRGSDERMEDQETEKEYIAYVHTSRFYSLIHKCSHAAKVENNLDLFDYLKKLYENSPDSDKLCVGKLQKQVWMHSPTPKLASPTHRLAHD